MLSAKGAYRVKEAEAPRNVVLLATGSEVAVALDTAAKLEEQGIGADVVSMPSQEVFEKQSLAYREDILASGENVLRVSIEAGVTQGWERYVGTDGLTIGIDRFGASAPAAVLFDHFGFSAEKIAPQIIEKLGN